MPMNGTRVDEVRTVLFTGARVAVTDVDEQRLGALARDASVKLTTVAADLTSAAAARRAVHDAAEMLGGLDVSSGRARSPASP